MAYNQSMQSHMPSRISTLHRYLISQSFYPLVLSSLLAMLMYTARVLLGHSWNYINLVWNLVLAWVPYLCSLIAFALFRKDSSHWVRLILPGLLWLGFFPNAPYMPASAIEGHGGGAGAMSAPGTFTLALVFLTAFALYYFINWKYLSQVWGLS